MNKIKWLWFDLKRHKRVWFYEPSKKELIRIVGEFWLFRHGARTEYKIYPWGRKNGIWYAPDICIPKKKLIVEADGGVHTKTKQRDYIRDHRLEELGYSIRRITTDNMKNPRKVRKEVRRFLRG